MTETVWVGTIKIAVRASSSGEAYDAVGETLRPLLGLYDESSPLLDWSYVASEEHDGEGLVDTNIPFDPNYEENQYINL